MSGYAGSASPRERRMRLLDGCTTGPPSESWRGDSSSLPAMELGLDGKVALVTGASKGLGHGIAAALAAEGARVAISSRSKERIDAAAAEIGARGYVYDSTDVDAAPGLLEAVEAD